jgi:hypothetical protein
MTFWDAILKFADKFNFKLPTPARDNNRWNHGCHHGEKCHKYERWPHKHIRRKLAKKSRQINRKRAA